MNIIINKIKSINYFELLFVKATPLFISLTIAELFFKFGSFTLECLAFLGLWGTLNKLMGISIKKRN